MLLGIHKTDKELPTNHDFMFGFIQTGELFGEAMVEGLTWAENGIWYFKPYLEETIYQVDRNILTVGVAAKYPLTDDSE